eukprot:6269933-Alexandrium_andersonii.AAC.1
MDLFSMPFVIKNCDHVKHVFGQESSLKTGFNVFRSGFPSCGLYVSKGRASMSVTQVLQKLAPEFDLHKLLQA